LPHQIAFTAVATVKPESLDALRSTLREMAADPAGNRLIPFHKLNGVHFARSFLLEPTTDVDGRPIAGQLVFMADWDAPLEQRIQELAEVGTEGLSRLFSSCEGYASGGGEPGAAIQYLRRHAVSNAAVYVNTIGLSASQVIDEGRLRDALEDYLDQDPDLRSAGPGAVRRALVDRVASTAELSWAAQPADPPALAWKIRELAHLLLVPLIGVLLLPVIVVALPIWLVVLRLHEHADVALDSRPDPARVSELAALEDHGPVNQFTAAGFIKTGWFRSLTARLVLFLISYGVRHIFNRANLAGVKTIHFARWTFIDGGRRVIFASNYDGSLESYMDDFIDKVAWGLNAVFSNGQGYPATRWLLFGGARNETAFKNYLRAHQIPTQVWYASSSQLTALNIANNRQLRRGLRGAMSDEAASAWLRRL